MKIFLNINLECIAPGLPARLQKNILPMQCTHLGIDNISLIFIQLKQRINCLGVMALPTLTSVALMMPKLKLNHWVVKCQQCRCMMTASLSRCLRC